MSDLAVLIGGNVLSVAFFGTGGLHFLHVDAKVRLRGALWVIAGLFAQMIMGILLDSTLAASYHAAFIAILLWIWWNRGGGDGLKRRMKSWTHSLRHAFLPQTA